MESTALPLVSVGVPVRNGADTLHHMLASIDRQTYPRIEVVIADNASEDATPEVISTWARGRQHVHLIRHPSPVSMWQNFESVFRQARGKYFMWAADDDILSDEWVAELVRALESEPGACLAFGDIVRFTEYSAYRQGVPQWHDPSLRGLPAWRKLLSHKDGGYAVEGLFRSACLANYRFWDHEVSPDWPLLCYVHLVGEVLHTRGPIIYLPHKAKTGEERAAAQSYRTIGGWPTARLSWTCAKATRAAAAMTGSRRIFLVDAALVFAGLLWSNRRHLVRWQLEGWRISFRADPRAEGPECDE